jgi:hypothetical protein
LSAILKPQTAPWVLRERRFITRKTSAVRPQPEQIHRNDIAFSAVWRP